MGLLEIAGWKLGFLVGFVPTFSMYCSYLLLSFLNIPPVIESIIQNFAGGLILAAVAAELFPLMLYGTQLESSIGITIGFSVGLTILYGLEYVIESIEAYFDGGDENNESLDVEVSQQNTNVLFKSVPKGFTSNIESQQNGDDLYSALQEDNRMSSSKFDSSRMSLSQLNRMSVSGLYKKGPLNMRFVDWNDNSVEISKKAFQSEDHRKKILDVVKDINSSLSELDNQSQQLIDSSKLSVAESDSVGESIDQQLHNFQYKLDYCRRLIEGSFSQESVVNPIGWLTNHRKIAMRLRIRNLQLIGQHLLEHLVDLNVDPLVVKELHAHLDQMDEEVKKLHDSVSKFGQRWVRSHSRPLPVPEEGDTLPVGLIIPVTLDCFVDGFMIGITCALSPPAGIILGAANCLEMFFLGLAYATRITKCTGSSVIARNLSLYIPPFIMFLAAGLGAAIGEATYSVPLIYVSLVAFGCVALLALVCTELLIEAKENQGDEERWYVDLFIFLGIFIVLILAKAGI